MAEWFFRALLLNLIFWTWGIWGVRKLLRENPWLKGGVVTLIKRFFF